MPSLSVRAFRRFLPVISPSPISLVGKTPLGTVGLASVFDRIGRGGLGRGGVRPLSPLSPWAPPKYNMRAVGVYTGFLLRFEFCFDLMPWATSVVQGATLVQSLGIRGKSY